MHVYDLDGTVELSDQSALLHRLRAVRRGPYGAFILSHDDSSSYPALFVHINGSVAYVHYFPSENHPGFQPDGMTPDGCTSAVHFLQADGNEADIIEMPASTLVTAEVAFLAARDFLVSPKLPASISWVEL